MALVAGELLCEGCGCFSVPEASDLGVASGIGECIATAVLA